MPNRHVSPLWVLAALTLGSGAGLADDARKATEPAADEELLEFLGSVDSAGDSTAASDDGSWIEYLSKTDLGKADKAATAPAASGAKPVADQAAGAKPDAAEVRKDE